MEIEPVYAIILAVQSLAFILALLRLIKGPDLADRVVAFDVMTTTGIGFICVYAVAMEKSVFLEVASVVALVAFLATIAFAYYLRRKV